MNVPFPLPTRAPRLCRLACALALCLAWLAGCSEPAPSEEIALIRVRDFGEIALRFFPDKAPGHVANFKKLARAGFYEGTSFHRVLPGMLIHGGDGNSRDADPTNDGQGTPGYTIPAEFNDVPHRRGIVSMARTPDPNSAGSQFFIMVADHKDWKDLFDGKYTVFGEVIRGMDVADRIAWTPKDRSTHRPLADVVIESVRIVPG